MIIDTDKIAEMPLEEKIAAINAAREELHNISPFRDEPVDFVKWVRNTDIEANEYNPNSVAPPEMELLRVSIMSDGYTQPIVSDRGIVVDGFHRNRVGKECEDVRKRVHGYLPIVQIRETQGGINDRMASTIRHNRARGKHKIEAMSDIVIELKRRNWSDEKICKNLGMEQDEILRLCQITGLSDIFSDQEFSRSWDVEGIVTEADFIELTDDVEAYASENIAVRTVNTSDENRIFHTYDKWECYAAGFYSQRPPKGMTPDDCRKAYAEFLSDVPRFSAALDVVTNEWVNSCEHYLTNAAMNRIAWLGQAAMCQATGIPSEFRGGYFLLSEEEKDVANRLAHTYLNRWLVDNGMPTVSYEEAAPDRQSDIY